MRSWIKATLFIFLPVQISIAAPVIDDFAYRAELTPTQQQLQNLELPMEVLKNITSSNIDDIAVFDSFGKALPHSARKVLPHKIKKQLDVKFHAFDIFQKQHSKTITTREQSQQDGQISESQITETVDSHTLRQDYLIELPNIPDKVDLELLWRQQPVNQLLQVKIETGADLDNMHIIDGQKVLSNVNPNSPEWRFIRNIARGQKYLRITAAEDINEFELLQVTAHYEQKLVARRLWHEVKLAQQNIENKNYLSFDSPSAVATNAIRIKPGEPHSTIQANLFASNKGFKNKRRIRSGMRQHNLIDNDIKPSLPIALPALSYRHWWISLTETPSVLPSVELAYPVYQMIFLGNNNPPYTLAWGNYQSERQITNLADLSKDGFNHTKNPGSTVSLKTVHVAGGNSRLAPESELPWKKWLLWALLSFAALVTGRMAYGLYRDMSQ